MDGSPLYTHNVPLDARTLAAAWGRIGAECRVPTENYRKLGEAFGELRRTLRYSKRTVQAFRTFHGRLPRGWRKHVRRMKAERRNANV